MQILKFFLQVGCFRNQYEYFRRMEMSFFLCLMIFYFSVGERNQFFWAQFISFIFIWYVRQPQAMTCFVQYTSSVDGVSLPTDYPPRESDCSHSRSKVSSDWLPSYIKFTWPVLEIFKIVRILSGHASYLMQCTTVWYFVNIRLDLMIL